jgi:hypothetical protein
MVAWDKIFNGSIIYGLKKCCVPNNLDRMKMLRDSKTIFSVEKTSLLERRVRHLKTLFYETKRKL